MVLNKLILFCICLAVTVFVANLGALVDAFLHPSIPYFDDEHLIVGGVSGLVTGSLFGLLLLYIHRLQTTLQERGRVEKEKEKLLRELQEAMDQLKVLKGMLPICASCKRIRDDQGKWTQLETYIRNHSEADFSHSICPECAQTLYPELSQYKKDRKASIPASD